MTSKQISIHELNRSIASDGLLLQVRLLLSVALTLIAVPVAALDVQETTDFPGGSSFTSGVSVGVLDSGLNTISGGLAGNCSNNDCNGASAGDTQDSFLMTVPAGLEIEGLTLTSSGGTGPINELRLMIRNVGSDLVNESEAVNQTSSNLLTQSIPAGEYAVSVFGGSAQSAGAFSLNWSLSISTTADPVAQRDALIALYNATDGDNWTNNAGWLGAAGTECSWFGVTCAGGAVVRIFLENNGLTGTIPPEIGQLGSLDRLFLGNNQLSGPIPPEWGQLSSATFISLYDNQLSGSLPPELGQLSNLEVIELFGNELAGPIPPELSQLTKLQTLSLSNNQLSGSIPVELSQLANLRRLSLSRNELSGPIPPELGQLSNLESLVLNSNALTGPIPAELSQLTNLQMLRLGSNELSGPIPPELGQLVQLTSLSLRNNELSGSIPPELGQLIALEQLGLDSNQLSGPIPFELGQLTNLQLLDLRFNQLSGPIPVELSQLSNLRQLLLNFNQLAAPIPVELSQLSNLRQLVLNNNQLTGLTPPELSQLTNLQLLSLSSNQLSGPIPPELGQLGQLTSLSLWQNELSGPIPVELSQLTNLQRLWLEDNQLTGPIPAELSQLTNLQWLWLSNNQLGGPIPPELGELTNATQIDLERNNLSGPVPMELGNLDTNLEFLGLAQNPSLTGTIPQSLLDRQAQGLLTITFDGTSVIGCEAQRVLPEGYIPGLPLTVTIQTQPETGTGSYAIEDQPPSSWAVSNVQGGVFDSGTGTVKFGPYFDANSRTLQYDLTPPANASGTGVFSGTYSKDGVSTGLCGPSTLEPSRSDLVVSKVASVATAAPGEQFSYTLTVSNNGPNTAQGVVLTDTLPGDLALLSASADCTGLSVVECSVGDLTPGAVASFTLEVEVSDTAPAGAIDNTVSVSAITPDPNPSNDTSTATVEIEKLSALNLVINQIDASSCPDMSALVTVTDQFGQSLGGLTGSNFTLAEDGQSLPFSLSTVSTGSSSRLAVSIVIDRSTSLSNADLMN
ncbi:leucine-rich repeat domain-containing protein, partial [Wenzhouxiangella limi]